MCSTLGLLKLKLKKPRKRQPQNVEPEQIEDLNSAQVRLLLIHLSF